VMSQAGGEAAGEASGEAEPDPAELP
jgi:hypothetical protein